MLALSTTFTPAHAARVNVVDDLGRKVQLARMPQRIISLAPSVTEILFAVGAQGRLVGDTDYCDYPAQAKLLPHVGAVMNPSAEKMLSLRPDLIVIASQTLPASEADSYSRQWHTPVFVTAAGSYVQVEKDIQMLGALFGDASKTRAVIARMESAGKTVATAVAGRPKPSVFIDIWNNPLTTASGGSFIGDLVRRAGGRNIAENLTTGYPSYSLEQLTAQNPDAILIDSGSDADFRRLPGVDHLKATKSGHIINVPGDETDRPGPRLADGLLFIARALHPEAFTKAKP